MPKLASLNSHALGSSNLEAKMLQEAQSGDILFSVTPATVTPAPTAAAWTRDVVVKVVNSLGNTHTWVNTAITTGVSIANDSTDGTATIPSTTLTLVDGMATITITGDAEAWLNSETDTLTVAEATISGVTLAAKTSVETFTTV